jgi:sulfate adenylyltransferase
MSLVPVHGGLSDLINRTLPWSARKSLIEKSSSLPSLTLNEGDLATLHRIADGTLSPLEGFMDEAEHNLVLDHQHIVRGGAPYAWTIPLSLPVTDEERAALSVGGEAILRDPSGAIVGVIEISSIFGWDKARFVEKVYGTARMDHPGADIVTRDARATLVGGKIQALPPAVNPAFGEAVLPPRVTRAIIAARGYEAALAFQTRNPLHRAHEYALVYGAETLTRQGLYTGVFLNPLVGQLKGDDVDAATRMRTYRALQVSRSLGEGDSDKDLWEAKGYDLNDVFHLVGLDMRMFYGGPAEAVMHAIYRQNHGFSHIVIGRKHADAPYHDKTAIWGDFDAQEIFGKLQGALSTKPVNVGFAAYYESIGRVDLTENHPNEKPLNIAGTKIREALVSGERPDPRVMRPSTADILIEAYRAQG